MRTIKNFLLRIEFFNYCLTSKRNKYITLTLLISYVGGIILGIVFNGQQKDIMMAVGGFSNYYFIIFSSSSLGEIFFNRILNNMFTLLVIFAIGLLIYIFPLHYVIHIYRGYIAGCVFAFFVATYNISGIMVLAFVIIPVQFLVELVLASASSFAINYSLDKCTTMTIYDYVWGLVSLVLATIVVCLIELVLIAIIIRPLNFML